MAGGVVWLVAFFVQVLRREWAQARTQLGVAAVWIFATLSLIGWSRFNLKLAEDRAPIVIVACRRFESDRGRLPSSLDELVPDYLPQVPAANWTLFGAFLYESDRGELSYLYPWPSARIYSFASDRWDSQRINAYQGDRESSVDPRQPGDA